MTADIVDLESRPYRLGLIHDAAPSLVPDLHAFATSPVPKPPAEVSLIHTDWPMALNDKLGDCTIAGALHVNQAGNVIAAEPWTYCGDDEVDSTYMGLTGGQDTGLLLPQVLNPWHMGPFLGQPPNGGFASVRPKNTNTMKQAIWIFGNAYCAVDLPMPAQEQFRPDGSGVWTLTGTDADYQIEGGHCIVAVAYTAEGIWFITWGGVVLATWEWWFTYGVQAYAVVPPGFVARGGDARGFSLHAMDNYLPKV